MRKILFLLLFLVTTLACSVFSPASKPTAAPARIPATRAVLPATEDEVPRVTVQEAKAALDSGEAILLDVRSAASYSEAHIKGAFNLPLTLIESNPANIEFNKDRWIITYCT